MTVYTGYTQRPCTKSHRSCALEISLKHNVQSGDSAPRTNRSKRAKHLDLPSNAVAAGFIQNRPTVVSITFFPIFVFYPLFVVYALLYNMCIMYRCIACWPRAVNEKKKIKKYLQSERTHVFYSLFSCSTRANHAFENFRFVFEVYPINIVLKYNITLCDRESASQLDTQ